MPRRLLFLVLSDPRTSPRPAEAVRIAAGLAAWQEAAICVYFGPEAAVLLSEEADFLPAGDSFPRHLALLRGAGVKLLTDPPGAAADYPQLLQEIFQSDSVSVW